MEDLTKQAPPVDATVPPSVEPTFPARRPVLTGWRARFVVSVLALLPFALLEAGLWIAGYRTDPQYENFAPDQPVFRQAGGIVRVDEKRSRHFRMKPFLAQKPAGATRVFVVGDSVAAGFVRLPNGYTFLEESYPEMLEGLLGRAYPGRSFEVVNCGGAGYASYRLKQVMAKVPAYEPDLVVIMTGSSEFVEARHFKNWQGIKDAPGLSLLMQWKTLALARDLLRHVSTREQQPQKSLDEDSASLPWIEQDLVHGEEEIRLTCEHSARNVEEMLRICRQAGVPVLLCTATCNLRTPCGVQIDLQREDGTATGRLLRSADKLIREGQCRRALAELEPALDDYEQDYVAGAAVWFMAARAAEGVQDYPLARRYYLKAKDLDPHNWRTQSRFNESLRRLAEQPGVALVDVEQAFWRAAPDGIPDSRIFFDNCHPRPEGHKLIAETILDVIQRHNYW